MLDGDFASIQPKLEAGASAGEGDMEPFLISLAISAKRQADALERIADSMSGQSELGSVLYWLEQIASATNAACGR